MYSTCTLCHIQSVCFLKEYTTLRKLVPLLNLCHILQIMPPDKEVEEKVLQNRFQYLSSNIPPDDVAIEMNTRGLLTVKEHEEYLSMKRAHTSDSTKKFYSITSYIAR